MKLKGRLKTIADMLHRCEVLADIGTDHAYIPVYAVKNNICSRAVATDLREGPIKKAKENISASGLDEYIETRRGYGLDPLLPGEADVVVIAGMGGLLIREILSKDPEKSRNTETLILQPMNSPELLRSWLYSEGFDIVDESLCKDEGRIYNIMKVRWSGEKRVMDEIECYIGSMLIEKRDPLLGELTLRKLKQTEKVLMQLKKSSESERTSDLSEYYERLRSKLEEIRDRLKSKEGENPCP